MTLSHRYINRRFLPDKAIDLMDEAAAKLRMERDSQPEQLDEISRRLRQLEIEREAIRREAEVAAQNAPAANGAGATAEQAHQAKLTALNQEIQSLEEEEHELKGKWEGERELLAKIQDHKQQIESLNHRGRTRRA